MTGEMFGLFLLGHLKIISSGEPRSGDRTGGWEHVSVSCEDRTPTWDEMCMVKDAFWSEEEAVVQMHPPRSQYVNLHPYCLHLWRDTLHRHRLPPVECV